MKNFLALFLLINASIVSFSQEEKVTVNFLVEVDNGYFEILIDDSIFLKIYKTELLPGTHTAKVWSPGYLTAEVDFEVKAGEKTAVNVPMVISNERQNFERDYKDYRMQFHKHLTIPVAVTLASAVTTVTFMTLAYNSKNTVQKNIELYHSSPNYKDVITYKGLVDENNSKYNKRRAGFYTSVSLTGLSLAATIFTYTRFKKNFTEPKLNSSSPFKDRFSFIPSPLGFHLTYKIG